MSEATNTSSIFSVTLYFCYSMTPVEFTIHSGRIRGNGLLRSQDRGYSTILLEREYSWESLYRHHYLMDGQITAYLDYMDSGTYLTILLTKSGQYMVAIISSGPLLYRRYVNARQPFSSSTNDPQRVVLYNSFWNFNLDVPCANGRVIALTLREIIVPISGSNQLIFRQSQPESQLIGVFLLENHFFVCGISILLIFRFPCLVVVFQTKNRRILRIPSDLIGL